MQISKRVTLSNKQLKAVLKDVNAALILSAQKGELEEWRDNWKGSWLEPYFPKEKICEYS